MIWLTSISSLVLLGTGIAMAIWIAKLKNTVLKLTQEANDTSCKLGVQKALTKTTKRRLDTALIQLERLRERHAELLDKIQSGSLCDAGGIVVELRRLLQKNPPT